MRVLAIRGGGLGDIILTVPSFIALKSIVDELYIAVPFQWDSLFDGFAELIPIEGSLIHSLWDNCEEFEKVLGRFDIAVTWHWDKEEVFIKNLSKIANKVVYGDIKPERVHQSLKLFSPILQISGDIKFPDYLRLPNLPYWKPEGKEEIIIHPGSGSIKKVWPIENFLFIIERFLSENKKIKVILGEAEERKEFSVFFDMKGVEVKRNLPLRELIKEILDGIVYIGNDSGISHLSALLGVPTIVLFKETDPEIWAPKGERVYILSTYPENEWVKKEKVFEFVEKIFKQILFLNCNSAHFRE